MNSFVSKSCHSWKTALNRALAPKLPPGLWRRGQDVAMDFHDRPYYGKSPQEAGFVGSWSGQGWDDSLLSAWPRPTSWRTLCASLWASALCCPGQVKSMSCSSLLQQVQELDVPLHRLLLDRGFAGIEVQEFLDQQAIPALIACPIRGKTGGTRALCRGRKSYRTQHPFKGANGRSRTAELVCVGPSPRPSGLND